jgi:hypothetical protein
VVNARLHDHFECEFHPPRIEFERQHCVATKAAQTTIKIPARAPVQCSTNQGQERVAQKSVQWGHSPRRDPTPETVAEHQVISVAKLLEKRLQGQKVIAVVGVAHYHEPAARFLDARAKGVSVSSRGDRHHAGAKAGSDRLRAVAAAIVGNDHLTVHIVHFEVRQRLLNTDPHRLRLVEARHNDGQFRRKIACYVCFCL